MTLIQSTVEQYDIQGSMDFTPGETARGYRHLRNHRFWSQHGVSSRPANQQLEKKHSLAGCDWRDVDKAGGFCEFEYELHCLDRWLSFLRQNRRWGLLLECWYSVPIG
jgi:hypothetical protein